MNRDGSNFGNVAGWCENPFSHRRRILILIALMVGGGAIQRARADGATRDLSAYSGPGVAFTVSIALDPPAGTIVAGVEEAPPASWGIANISDGGTWDDGTDEIKWGPLFDPSIPAAVTYDLTPPGEVTGDCFAGTVSFDTLSDPIGGNLCITLVIPSVSEWGIVAMALLLLTAGALIFRRRGPSGAAGQPSPFPGTSPRRGAGL